MLEDKEIYSICTYFQALLIFFNLKILLIKIVNKPPAIQGFWWNPQEIWSSATSAELKDTWEIQGKPLKKKKIAPTYLSDQDLIPCNQTKLQKQIKCSA